LGGEGKKGHFGGKEKEKRVGREKTNSRKPTMFNKLLGPPPPKSKKRQIQQSHAIGAGKPPPCTERKQGSLSLTQITNAVKGNRPMGWKTRIPQQIEVGKGGAPCQRKRKGKVGSVGVGREVLVSEGGKGQEEKKRSGLNWV